jgi:hypothetical protein
MTQDDNGMDYDPLQPTLLEEDPKQTAYAASREKHREEHPITMGAGLTQLSELRKMPYRDRMKLATMEQLEGNPELATKPKIYVASKARHRPRWRALRDTFGYHIISQWIDVDDGYSEDPTGLDYGKLWKACIQDVQDCDVLVLYVETDEHLKGALVELGVALGLKKEIIVTGDLGDNGTWFNHDQVTVSDKSIEEVMDYIYHG